MKYLEISTDIYSDACKSFNGFAWSSSEAMIMLMLTIQQSIFFFIFTFLEKKPSSLQNELVDIQAIGARVYHASQPMSALKEKHQRDPRPPTTTTTHAHLHRDPAKDAQWMEEGPVQILTIKLCQC